MRHFKLWLSLSFSLILLAEGVGNAQSWDGTGAETFVLDEDDSGTQIRLRFGTAADKYLEWDTVNLRFNFNDTVRITGNIEAEGNVLTLDAENAGAGANIDIVANQGSDNDGTLRYNATTNQWEVSNDGGAFAPLGGGGSATQLSATIADGAEQLFTHSSDPNFERVVDVYFEDAETINDTTTWDVLTAEEGLYTQENAAITDFTGDSIRLEPSGVFTPGATNLSLAATAIGSDTTRPFANANDDDINTFWYNQGGGPSTNQWWGVDLGAATTVMRAEVHWFSTTYHATTMDIQGSNDGTVWNTVATVNPTGVNTEQWDFAPTTYRYWRFLCVTGNNATFFVLDEGRFFEAIGGGYSTTPAYVTTGASKAIDTTAWSQINTTDIIDNQPANTEMRYLFSFDSGTTWSEFSGGTWNAQTLTNIETVGMTAAAVEALTPANWNAAGGLNSGTNTLNYAVSVATTDTNATPVHSGIEINYNTQTYWQKGESDTVRVRLYDDVTTGVQNNTGSSKPFRVNVIES